MQKILPTINVYCVVPIKRILYGQWYKYHVHVDFGLWEANYYYPSIYWIHTLYVVLNICNISVEYLRTYVRYNKSCYNDTCECITRLLFAYTAKSFDYSLRIIYRYDFFVCLIMQFHVISACLYAQFFFGLPSTAFSVARTIIH